MATPANKAQAKNTATAAVLFHWEGTDKRGHKMKGEMASSSQAAVRAQLRKQGIDPKLVKKKAKPLFGERTKTIAPLDICIFTRQLATMMKAGVPLIQSFDITAEGVENPSLRQLIMSIRNDVAGGTSFAQSLAKHPRYFDELFCSLVGSGEQSGTLETMLDRLATYKEKSEALKKKVKKALTYPAAVIIVALVVTGILLVKVVPTFAETFQSFGANLPAFTLFVLNLSELAQQWWYIILIGLIIAGVGFREARLRSKPFSEAVDRTMLKIPVVGNILYQSIVARFSRTLATTFGAGVPLVDALDSVAGAAGNSVFYKAIKRIRDEVTTGTQMAQAIRNTELFPNMLLQMVAIGEESGKLDEMLDKVANHYEEEVDAAVDSLSSLLEPMIMSVLGILVGGLMVAMYLPIFQLGAVV